MMQAREGGRCAAVKKLAILGIKISLNMIYVSCGVVDVKNRRLISWTSAQHCAYDILRCDCAHWTRLGTISNTAPRKSDHCMLRDEGLMTGATKVVGEIAAISSISNGSI
jgi:hypothetical protein